MSTTDTASKLTSKDIFDLYKEWHEAKFEGRNYVAQGFIGNELSTIKKVATEHGVYRVLCGLYIGLRESPRPTSATYLMKGYWRYLPDCDRPDLYYLILTKGTPADKLVWRQLMHVETKWFPTADDLSKKNELVLSLEDSLDAKATTPKPKKTRRKRKAKEKPEPPKTTGIGGAASPRPFAPGE